MEKNIKKSNICVISMTYNRLEYVERSFVSLYKRSGCKFDHYVIDDCSDEKTQKILFKLKNKYHFNLFTNEKRMGIYRSFYANLKNIPLDYDYYLKLDSDIELLSENLLSEMIENFKYPDKVGGITPRTEGIRNIDKHDSLMQFYGGHAIKIEAPVSYGCCMLFPNITFTSFKRLNDKEIEKSIEKWGIDSILLDHAKRIGKYLIIEDLSVYHIDNAYGQRKNNDCYFTDRKRWNIIDNDEVWYMKASKILYPSFLDRSSYDRIRKLSINFDKFLENCFIFVKDNTKFEKKVIENEIEEIKQTKKQPTYMKTMFRITSPNNFRPDPNIKHGESKLFADVPEWAKNNIRIVIEKIDVEDEIFSNLKENDIYNNGKNLNSCTKTEEIKIKKDRVENETIVIAKIDMNEKTIEIKETKKIEEKMIRKCKKCDYTTTSLKRLKNHQTNKHG